METALLEEVAYAMKDSLVISSRLLTYYFNNICLHIGEDCSTNANSVLMHYFRENFERGYINVNKWEFMRGGEITQVGCGPLRPFGYRYFAHFNKCGQRILRSKELDISIAW